MFVNNICAGEVMHCRLSPVADHCPTVLDLRLKCWHGPARQRTDFNNGDMNALTASLKSADWSQVFQSSDVSKALDCWYETLLTAVAQFGF